MSFSFTYMGKASKVKSAIAEFAAKQTGDTKTEVDAIVPALNDLIDQNMKVGEDPLIEVLASGHAGFDASTREKKYGNVTVSVKPIYSTLIE